MTDLLTALIILGIGIVIGIIGSGIIDSLETNREISPSDANEWQCIVIFSAFLWPFIIPLEILMLIGFGIYQFTNRITTLLIEKYG